MIYLINKKNNDFISLESYKLVSEESYDFWNIRCSLSFETYGDPRIILYNPFVNNGKIPHKKDYVKDVFLYDTNKRHIIHCHNTFITAISIDDGIGVPLCVEVEFDHHIMYHEENLNELPELFRFIRLQKIKRLLNNGDQNTNKQL